MRPQSEATSYRDFNKDHDATAKTPKNVMNHT
ncbi:hypothetical protein A2U01_0061924, partial [Trifolium medium]|nr:hypothetical protein [Trifolium medium]